VNINSYPSVYALGHSAIKDLFDDEVLIQEKVDGSQFSFSLNGDTLYFKSKRCQVYPNGTDMFQDGVKAITEIQHLLTPGWIYRGEYLNKPKHNVVCYKRIPIRNIIIFDINDGLESYLSPVKVKAECDKIGLEYVPIFFKGKINNFEDLEELLKTESCLGNTIEGIVIKNYSRFGQDKKCLMGKWVREEIKEKISGTSKKSHKDIFIIMGLQLRTEARWRKAIQHLKEQGLISNEPKDIGPLMKEIHEDILKEEKEEIKEELFKWAWKKIARIITSGFPEWYKQELAKSQFEGERNE